MVSIGTQDVSKANTIEEIQLEFLNENTELFESDPNLIPCHSSGTFGLFSQYTACSTCSIVNFYRGSDQGQCNPSGTGEG